jgi:hypothetical protein
VSVGTDVAVEVTVAARVVVTVAVVVDVRSGMFVGVRVGGSVLVETGVLVTVGIGSVEVTVALGELVGTSVDAGSVAVFIGVAVAVVQGFGVPFQLGWQSVGRTTRKTGRERPRFPLTSSAAANSVIRLPLGRSDGIAMRKVALVLCSGGATSVLPSVVTAPSARNRTMRTPPRSVAKTTTVTVLPACTPPLSGHMIVTSGGQPLFGNVELEDAPLLAYVSLAWTVL